MPDPDSAQLHNLTLKLITDYFHGDSQTLLHYAAKDCSWIGPWENTYAKGAEDIREVMAQSAASRPYGDIDLKAKNAFTGNGLGIITLNFTLSDRQHPSRDQALPFRLSAVWKTTGDKSPRLIHAHLSRALTTLVKNELFPSTLGRENYNVLRTYFKNQDQVATRQSRFIYKDIESTWHFTHPLDIRYILAQGNHTQIFTQNAKPVTANHMFGRIFTSLPDSFIQIRRDTAINPLFFKSLSHTTLTLVDGTPLRCAVKRLPEIKARLAEKSN